LTAHAGDCGPRAEDSAVVPKVIVRSVDFVEMESGRGKRQAVTELRQRDESLALFR